MRTFLRDMAVVVMLLAMTACTAPSSVLTARPTPSLDAGLLSPTRAAEQIVSAASRLVTTATLNPSRAPVSGAAKASAGAAEPSEHLGTQTPTSAAEPSAEPLAQPAARMTTTQYLDIAPDDDRAQYALIGREMITSTAPAAVPVGVLFPAAALVDLNRCAATDACFAEDEAATLAGGVPGVERVGNQLRIHHSNGLTSVFTHQRGRGGGGWATYRYLGYIPELAQHLLRVSYYEGGDYMLVAATDGATTMLWTVPTIAPDGQRLAAAGAVPFGGPLRVQVWQVESTGLAGWHSLDIFGTSDFVASYRAIDAEAGALPGWMNDGWEPIDDVIVTDDIPMRLYRKTFEPGEVTLGANWMPPASRVRSHYLLFVK